MSWGHAGWTPAVGTSAAYTVEVGIAVAVGGADSFSLGSPHPPGASEAPARELKNLLFTGSM